MMSKIKLSMLKLKACLCILVILSALIFAGCWDYRGLHEQTIVAGMAVDVAEEGEGYSLTLEVVDVAGANEGQFGSLLLTTTGETLSEAVFDAYAKLHGNVYLGIMDVVFISQQVAEAGVSPLVEYLVRDRNARSNLHIVVAGTDRAAELLGPTADEDEPQQIIRAKVLGESLRQHRQGAAKAAETPQALEIFNRLITGVGTLALPVVAVSEAEDIPFQLDGLALFTGDRMTGHLPEADMPIYLLATTGLRDRVVPVDDMGPKGETRQAVLAVRRSESDVRFDHETGRLRFWLDIELEADVVELSGDWGQGGQERLRQIEAAAAETLTEQVHDLARRLGEEGQDIFGLLETVRHQNRTLWQTVAEQPQKWLQGSEIQPQIQVQIKSTGMIER